mmetsp:Transcript_18652/g.31901  ORF Transcript_18652/g.31901 Transcript_18652/m.31901 type:complete len:124 (+) Transcript_18652:413-784(+)
MKVGMSQLGQKRLDSDEVMSFLHQNIGIVIGLQAWVRGNRDRKKVEMLRGKQMGSKKYFTKQEYRETFAQYPADGNMSQTSRSFRNGAEFQNQPKEVRPPFKFQSGSVYSGQWKGNFRDGFGT